jgi:hypothetical protein
MNALGQKVLHSAYGEGVIIAYDERTPGKDGYITVKFKEKSAKFPYPMCFERFLEAVDSEFKKAAESELAEYKEMLKERESKQKESYPTPNRAPERIPGHISYCSINTFTFTNVREYNRLSRRNITVYGYVVYDYRGRKVGVTHMHTQREVACGQAEICFFERYEAEFGVWRLVSIDGERLLYSKLENILRTEGNFTATIHPRKGS